MKARELLVGAIWSNVQLRINRVGNNLPCRVGISFGALVIVVALLACTEKAGVQFSYAPPIFSGDNTKGNRDMRHRVRVRDPHPKSLAAAVLLMRRLSE